jgi:MFS family permease
MKMKATLFKDITVSPVIKFLTYSDILMMSGWGLISPILSVFITDQIPGGTVEVAGLASTIYFLVKSFLQIPVARYIDKRKGENDDFNTMILGSLIITLSAFLYIFVKTPAQLYLVQALYGVGGALSYPSWLALFTRHVDKNEEGLEWSLYYTTTDLGAALAAGLGGFIAASFGYSYVFLSVGISSLLGTAFLYGIRGYLWKK